MAKICMLLTTTPWDDMRLFYWQAPGLLEDGHEVLYMSGKPNKNATEALSFSPLSTKERKLARFSGSINLFRKICKQSPDVIQLCSIEQLPLGLMLKIFTKIKVIYDCREDMYYAFRDHKDNIPLLLRRFSAWSVKILEYICSCIFDGIVASDPATYNIHKAMPKSRKMIFYNTPPLSLFSGSYKPLSGREYDVVLMGSMSRRTGVIELLEAVGKLKESGYDLKVLLLGEPSNSLKEPTETVIHKHGLEGQINITGRIKYTEVPKVLSQAKIGIVGLLDMPKFRNNIACKAFEYMACGMPVISSDLPPERLFLKEGETAVFIEPGDTAALARAIRLLLDDLPSAEMMGQAGRREIELHWNAEDARKMLCQFYHRIIKTKRRKWFTR